jgi:hypothetical protein
MRKSYWFLGHHQTILAGAADTEGRYDLAEGRFPAGTQIPPHVHRRYSEHFYVLEGELILQRNVRLKSLLGSLSVSINTGFSESSTRCSTAGRVKPATAARERLFATRVVHAGFCPTGAVLEVT